MKQKHILQPKLRFPEFEDEWILKKIKDIAPLQRGFDLPSTELIKGEYPVVYSNGIQNYHSCFKVNGPGIITGRSGTIGKIHYVEGKYWPHNTSLWVTDFKGNEAKFIYYFFMKLDFTKFNAGSTVPTLNRNDVHDLKRIIPSLPEQQKIADYLSTIDTKINLLEEKKEQLMRYKKAMMQKLFSQEIRFKPTQCHTEPVEVESVEAYPEWEEKRLGELVSIKGGYAFKSNEFKDYGIPIIRISNISNTNNFIDKTNLVFHEEVDLNDNFKVFRNELVIALSGATTGKASLYNLDEFSYVNQRVGVFKTLNGCYYNYVVQFIFSSKFNRELSKLLVAGAQPNISTVDLESIVLSIPKNIEEQQKIADFLSAIDESIEKVNEQITQTQSFKKAMLQQMFV